MLCKTTVFIRSNVNFLLYLFLRSCRRSYTLNIIHKLLFILLSDFFKNNSSIVYLSLSVIIIIYVVHSTRELIFLWHDFADSVLQLPCTVKVEYLITYINQFFPISYFSYLPKSAAVELKSVH